jgi:dTDP-4-amino-4,6-dideoxygalactose transaminase
MNDQNVPILDLKAQYDSIREEVSAAISRVMLSQHFILGPEVEALEKDIAFYCQCEFGIGVSSGTDALLVSLMAIDIKSGDEVITSPYSFFATAGAIVRLGARPVFVDVDLETLNLQPALIESKITEHTRAILPVHMSGQMADMAPIVDIAHAYRLRLIEDACQAIGADYRGKRAGSMGDLGCLSFFPSKNLGGAGDSGMVVTNDRVLADKVLLLRNHGHRPKYYNKMVGGNFRMDALQAAIIRAKFPHLEDWTTARRRNATFYRQLFIDAGLSSDDSDLREQMPIILPNECNWGRHIYHLFQIRAKSRDELMGHLKQKGIGSEVYYPVPLHLQECFKELGYHPGDCPNAERLARETLALPIYPELSSQMIERVVQAVADFYKAKN